MLKYLQSNNNLNIYININKISYRIQVQKIYFVNNAIKNQQYELNYFQNNKFGGENNFGNVLARSSLLVWLQNSLIEMFNYKDSNNK